MRAAGSAAQSSSTTAAGNRGIVAGILRALGVSRSSRGTGASVSRALGTALAGVVVLAAALAFPASGAAATKYFDSTIGTPGNTVGLTFANAPRDVAVNEATGDVYIVDDANHRIQRVDADGGFGLMWGADVEQPAGGSDFEVCTDAADCKVGVPSGGNGTAAGNGTLDNPQGIAVDQDTGNVYVSDRDNRRISVYTADGDFVRSFGQDVVESGPGDQPPVGIDEVQTVRLNGAFDGGCFCIVDVDGGTFTLSFDPDSGGPQPVETTGAISSHATAAIVEQRLVDDLPSVAGGDIEVTGGPGPDTAWTLAFGGAYAGQDVAQMTGDGAALTPGGSVVVQTTTAGGPSPDYEVCEAGADVCQAGLGANNVGAGVKPGQYSAGTTVNGYRIDVSKPDGNASTGKVYLANTGSRRIEIFGLDGSAPTSTAVNNDGNNEFGSNQPLHVAVDSDEVVYATGVAGSGNHLARYDSESEAFLGRLDITEVTDVDGTGGIGGIGGMRGLEVDRSSGNLLVTTTSGATGVIELAAPASEEPEWVDSHVMRVPPSVSFVPAGIGIDPASGTLYATAPQTSGVLQGRTVVFDEDGLGPMEIVPGAATDVGATSANLAATVNPAVGGPTGQPTSYRFEVSKTGLDGSWTAVSADALVPPDGDTDAATPVQAPATGLEPNSVYRFRVVATRANNAGGMVSGEGLFFTDPAAPTVGGLRVDKVRADSASLRARINPNNQQTTYRFRYGVVGAAERQTSTVTLPADFGVISIAVQVDDLVAGATYRYSLVATNATGTTTSATGQFTTLEQASAGADCPNAELRVGPSAHLPDCRAYEMVSPVEKNGADIETPEERVGIGSHLSSSYRQAAVGGGKVTYSSAVAFANSVGAHWSNQYLSTRGQGGWSTEAISAPRTTSVLDPQGGITANFYWMFWSFFQGFTPDLSHAWVRDDNVDPLAEGALEGHVNLYRRENATGEYVPLTVEGPYGSNVLPSLSADQQSNQGGVRFLGASQDLSHQVLVAAAPLTADAHQPGPFDAITNQLYVLVDGELHLVSVLPNGAPATTNSTAGAMGDDATTLARTGMVKNAVSSDGSRIFWTATTSAFTYRGAGTLYVRENPGEEQSAIAGGECTEPAKACTVQIATNAQFWGASADGSKVLYSTGGQPNRTPRIYDVDTETTTEIATQSAGAPAMSDDLSRVYFVSRQSLAPGATAGESNLYLYDDGAYALIGPVTDDDLRSHSTSVGGSPVFAGNLVGRGPAGEPAPHPIRNATRATPDGRHFAFMSNSRALSEAAAGYDNTDANTGYPAFEVFRYDAESGQLSCVSCRPSGTRPEGGRLTGVYSPIDLAIPNVPLLRVGGSIPPWEYDSYASRVLSDDGRRLFFHSEDRLVAGDVNGARDVYQWQAVGSGDCQRSHPDHTDQNGGCVSLISTGKDPVRSEFVDADATGDEVFISTDQSIDARDTAQRDIYVAKAGGGFPSSATPPAEECGVLAGGCQGAGAHGIGTGERTSAPPAPGGGDAERGERRRLTVAVAGSRKARRIAARRGVLRVAVRASAAGRIRVAARARVGRRVRRVARRAVRLRKAGRTVLRLRLNGAARRQLRQGRRLRVAVLVSAPGARRRTATIVLAGAKS